MSNTTNVYVLELTDGKYYVGTSKDVNERYQRHLSGNGPPWTKKYTPIRIVETFANVDSFEENNVTKKYMAKFGIDNVRGGSYCRIVLPEEEVAILRKEIWASQGLCIRCGRKGHFVTNCYAKTTVDGQSIEDAIIDINPKNIVPIPEPSICGRCGREGHAVADCYAKTTINGSAITNELINSYQVRESVEEVAILRKEIRASQDLCIKCGRKGHFVSNCHVDISVKNKEDKLCTRCGRDTHTAEVCKNKTHVDGTRLDGKVCTRCGRSNHTVNKCYASTSVDGEPLEPKA